MYNVRSRKVRRLNNSDFSRKDHEKNNDNDKYQKDRDIRQYFRELDGIALLLLCINVYINVILLRFYTSMTFRSLSYISIQSL